MKIKAVCERTGLTDRTVRYYIEQGLISPAYEENYLGRKTFSFTEDDVGCLHHIAVLRRFDFSIDEIRELIEHPERSGRVILQVRRRKEQEIANSQEIVTALSGLSLSRPYTMDELARALTSPEWNPAYINEQPPRDWGQIVNDFLVSAFLFIATWLPVLVALGAIINSWKSYEYPVLNSGALLGLQMFILPTWLMLLFPKLKLNWRPMAKHVVHTLILIGCFNSILWCAAFAGNVFPGSLTTDMDDYLRFDAQSEATQSTMLREVFPTKENMTKEYPVSPIASYRFACNNQTDDVFLQRTLYEWELDTEVERIKSVFQTYLDAPDGVYTMYAEGEYGTYRYLTLYTGTEPFTQEDDDRSKRIICLFAYDETTHIVRYSWYYEHDTGAIFEASIPAFFESRDWGLPGESA